jgi:hypothetical protein
MINLHLLVLYCVPVMVVAYCVSNLARHHRHHMTPERALLRRCFSDGHLAESTCLQNYDSTGAPKRKEDTHLIVLIHGWMGNALEMETLKESLLQQSEIRSQRKRKLFKRNERVVIHAASCNEGLTHDGIVAGGRRVAIEINDLVQELWSKEQSSNKIRLSLVGNSLGGLYARFALSEIQWTDGSSKRPTKHLIPHHFVTTATPHLGCGFKQTYLPLPRFIESPIAHVMKQTGKDLFRFTSIIDDMTFSCTFTIPLSRFQQRIAYINVHGTDFQVPTPTAAFWADTDSVHHVVEDYSDNTSERDEEDVENPEEDRPRGIVMKLVTAAQTKRKRKDEDNMEDSSTFKTATTSLMSVKLDQLGWTKVLVDVRNEMPIITLRSKERKESTTNHQKKTEWTSRELLEQFDTGRLLSVPIGHTVMVANAKNEFYRKINKAGVPIMDYLAKEMINST